MFYKQEIKLTGGRNTDDDLKSLPEGDFLYAYNCHIGVTNQSHEGSVENAKGNTLVSFTLPAGSNRCIGRCIDAQRKAIVFFLWNSNGDHSIRRFFVDTNTVQLIVQDPVLGFRPEREYRIHSSNIIEEKLYWTNLALFPCKINMDRAIGYLNRWSYTGYFFQSGYTGFVSSTPPPFSVGDNITVVQAPGFTNPFYNGYATVTAVVGNTIITNIPLNAPFGFSDPGYIVLSSAYSVINQRVIDALKWPSPTSPRLTYFTDTTRSFNNLKRLLPQFSYRYIYDDYEKSVWSSYSKLGLPPSNETYYGEYFNGANENNGIKINVNTGPNIVKKIEIGVRFGNINDFVGFVILDKQELRIDDNVTYDYEFFNDESKYGIDQADIRRLFDNLPQLARGQELLSENVLAYGGCTEGFDNVPIDLKLSIIQEPITFSPIGRDSLPYIVLPPGFVSISTAIQLQLDVQPVEGSLITLSFTVLITNIGTGLSSTFTFRLEHRVSASDVSLYPSVTQILQDFKTQLESLHLTAPPPVPLHPPMQPLTVFLTAPDLLTFYSAGPNFTVISILDYYTEQMAVKYPGFKTGATHKIGIVYYNRGSQCGTVNEDKLQTPSSIYIPFPTEQVTIPNQNYRNKIQWELLNQPPDFATHYQLVYVGNTNVKDAIQYIITDIAFNGSNNKVQINLEWLNTHKDRYVGADQLPAYVFKAGDRIRFITGVDDILTDGIGPLLDGYYDLEISSVDTVDPNIIYITPFNYTETLPVRVGKKSLVEIYTPTSKIVNNNEFFFEIGEEYEIGNPHTPQRYHKGPIQNQDPNNYATTPAIGILERGDIYHIQRSMLDGSLQTGLIISSTVANPPGATTIIVPGNVFDSLTNGQLIVIKQLVGTTPFGENFMIDLPNSSYDPALNETHIAIQYTTGIPVPFVANAFVGSIVNDYNASYPVVLVESFNYSDFYESRAYDKGRANIIDANSRRKYLNIVRHSRRYIQETKVNGLNTFYDESVQFSDSFGLINKIIEVGYTLKVLQEQKNTSVYVGRTVMNKPDGTQDILGTNTILGTTVPQIENYGTMHPESVYRHDRYLYYYDYFGSRFIRDAANGPEVISDLKMKTFFRDKTNSINQIGLNNVHVFCEWDETFQKLLVTFWFTNTIFETLLSETIAFHESKNRWRETYAYYPEEFGQLGQTLISFKNGLIWIHNTNNTYNNFYGQQYDQKIRFAMNIEPAKHKVMGSIAVYSTEKWFADNNFILVPEHAEYPGGMRSRILPNKFVHKQGCYYAEFSRDANTPNANPATVYVNGRKLQGYVLDVMLKNDHTTFVLLDQVIIQSVPSEKSK